MSPDLITPLVCPHGVLKFTLHQTSYAWEFIAVPGQKFRDSGTAQCSMQKTDKRQPNRN